MVDLSRRIAGSKARSYFSYGCTALERLNRLEWGELPGGEFKRIFFPIINTTKII